MPRAGKRLAAERCAAREAAARKNEEFARRMRWYASDQDCDFEDFEKEEPDPLVDVDDEG